MRCTLHDGNVQASAQPLDDTPDNACYCSVTFPIRFGGGRWMEFEVGGGDEATFMRLLERLPDAARYETDAYRVYGRYQSTNMWSGSAAR